MVIVTVVLCSMSGIAAITLLQTHPSPMTLIVGLVALIGLLTIQLAHITWRDELKRRKWGMPALVVQAVMVYGPYVWLGKGWVGGPYFLAGSALLTLPRRYAWWAFGAVLGTITAAQAVISPNHTVVDNFYRVVYYFGSILGLGLAVFALSRLADLVRELHDTRAELAQLAVNQERLRFARDLHDLLGYSLSAITLKSELVYRLADRQTARAKEELESVLELARQALADVRAVSSSYRQMSLSAECASARSMLTATDIRLIMNVTIDEGMSGAANTVLATVLREGITNVLRHSKAQHCSIEATVVRGEARLTISNDGVRAQPLRSAERGRKGTGIENLAQRLQVVGGSLEAGVRRDGWFQLAASVPLRLADDRTPKTADDGARTSALPTNAPKEPKEAKAAGAAVADTGHDQGAPRGDTADHTAA
jgi:two-component system, NarL family, sensor histidine kinase DesK